VNGDVSITRATVEDAEQVLALIHRAFSPVAVLYNDPTLPPVTESLEEHRACYQTRVVLKAEDGGGALVGTIQGELRPDGTCYLARLAVEPGRQGQGIARALAAAIEDVFPEAARFELFTGHLSTASLGLYASLGYRETRREYVDDRLTLVWLEKVR
jgi:ribosomal protein S18 acetylase RimI-like enzyme